MTKEEKFIKKWERASKNGKKVYIIKMALFFIVVVTIVGLPIDLAFKGDFSQKAFEETFTLKYFIVKVITYTFVGIFLAFNSWNRGIKKHQIYKEYLENR